MKIAGCGEIADFFRKSMKKDSIFDNRLKLPCVCRACKRSFWSLAETELISPIEKEPLGSI